MKRSYTLSGMSILVAALISSCTITKDYQRPEVNRIDDFRGISTADSSTLADYRWEDFFQDEKLKGYIQQGLEYNYDVLKAAERLNIAGALLKQSKAAFAPALNANIDLAYSKPSTKTFSGRSLPAGTRFGDISAGIGFSWEIDIWGKLRSEKRAAFARYYQAAQVQNAVKSQLVFNVAYNYYLLQSLDAKRTIIAEHISNREEGVETIKSIKESGGTTEVAVKQNEALLYSARALLLNIENEIAVRENVMSTLLGRPPHEIERSLLTDANILDDLRVGLPIQLLSNRPDVAAAEYQLISALEMTNAARASLYPTLNILGSGGLNSRNFGDLFNVNALMGNIAGGILQPLFARRQLKTQKEVRMSEQEIALFDYQQTILTAYQEVSTELGSFNTALQVLTVKQSELEVLNYAESYSVELLANGLANYLEVLVAKDNALTTALEVIDTETELLVRQAALYKALGGGWK